MKTKIAYTGNPDEDLARALGMHLTRERTRAEADVLFGGSAAEMRKKEQAALNKLFIQTPAAESPTQAMNMHKTSSVEEPEPSIAPHVDAFFEKLAAPDEAQRRYPELRKVAQTPAPDLKPRTKTQLPVRASLSGGSA